MSQHISCICNYPTKSACLYFLPAWFLWGLYDWDLAPPNEINPELKIWCGLSSNKVTGLCYAGGSRRLLSAGADGAVGCWDMSEPRRETPTWQEADLCHLCHKPFFWNLRAMMDQRQLGMFSFGIMINDIISPIYWNKYIQNRSIYHLSIINKALHPMVGLPPQSFPSCSNPLNCKHHFITYEEEEYINK